MSRRDRRSTRFLEVMMSARLHHSARRAGQASRPKVQRTKRWPRNINELVAAGGPEAFVRNAAANAAATVASHEREFWLGFLEGVDQDGLDLQARALCSLYIRDLRRKLGIGQSKEIIREQTRLRVRRLRERRRAQEVKAEMRQSTTTATEPAT